MYNGVLGELRDAPPRADLVCIKMLYKEQAMIYKK